MTKIVTRSRAKRVDAGGLKTQIKTEDMEVVISPEVAPKERKGDTRKSTSGKRKRNDPPTLKLESGHQSHSESLHVVPPSPKRGKKKSDDQRVEAEPQSQRNEGRPDVAPSPAKVQSLRRRRPQAQGSGRKRSNAVDDTPSCVLRANQMSHIADELLRRREVKFTTDLTIIYSPVGRTDNGELLTI
ncbi:hypothetical protein L218DRAFT_1079007 [Marasmius fiardii PR-910]|nr:hypothetical protein L218DRAFT_1079007 [Marasmius fiardii PR-910]